MRLNSGETGVTLHQSPASSHSALRRAASGAGPVIIMIHGYKYDPEIVRHSPHNSIFASARNGRRTEGGHWLPALGFGTGKEDEGLAIAFGWRARGDLACAHQTARSAGRHLSRVVADVRAHAPWRAIHAVTHSMGSEVIFEALHALPANSFQRIVTVTGASFASRALSAMQTPAGRTADLFNITSRENDVFDALFERLVEAPHKNDRAMGVGLDLPNIVNIQIDCDATLAALTDFGGQICATDTCICHWSGYTRPGALQFYSRALRQPDAVPLAALRRALPATTAPRWSRFRARSIAPLALPKPDTPASCASEQTRTSRDPSRLLANAGRLQNFKCK